MSAVILQFPGPSRPPSERIAAEAAHDIGERLKTARSYLDERARNVGSTPEQLFQAKQVALRELLRGTSMGGTLAIAYSELPRAKATPRFHFRNPFRDPPEAA
jgi:hypothetical protein